MAAKRERPEKVACGKYGGPLALWVGDVRMNDPIYRDAQTSQPSMASADRSIRGARGDDQDHATRRKPWPASVRQPGPTAAEAAGKSG